MGFKVLLITHYLIWEILVETVLDVHARGVKIKKRFIDPNAVTINALKKRLIEKYICWYAHKEPYVPYDTMVE